MTARGFLLGNLLSLLVVLAYFIAVTYDNEANLGESCLLIAAGSMGIINCFCLLGVGLCTLLNTMLRPYHVFDD